MDNQTKRYIIIVDWFCMCNLSGDLLIICFFILMFMRDLCSMVFNLFGFIGLCLVG